MMFESIYFRVYFTPTIIVNSFVFTGSSGLTFTVGELPGSLASIGKFRNVCFFLDQFSFSFFFKHEGFPLRIQVS